MRNRLCFLSVILLGLMIVGAGGNLPAPVPVVFGPNIDLSVQNYSPGAIQAEATVAANPKDPLSFVTGYIDRVPNPSQPVVSYHFTTDGGQTWTFGGPVPLENSTDGAGDPALAADADGSFYYSCLDLVLSATGGSITRTDVVVAKSTDGGRTFPTLSVVVRGSQAAATFNAPDKDYIGTDTWAGSPFRNNIYVAWTRSGVDGARIMVAVSRDHGMTWSDQIPVSPVVSGFTEGVFGALPVAAPDGTVYVFYGDFIFNTGPTSIRFSKSIDGGRTWSAPASVASGLPSPGFFKLQNGNPNWNTSQLGGISVSTLPTAAIAPDGTIFVAWTDFPNGSCVNSGSGDPACTNADVRLSVSGNGGKSWTRPVKVSDETNATDQFFPWIATHPNGMLSLSWADKRLDTNNINYDIFYTNTFDGSTYLPNVRVTTTTAPSGSSSVTDIRDYNGMAVNAVGIVPAWGQMVNTHPDVFTAVGRFAK